MTTSKPSSIHSQPAITVRVIGCFGAALALGTAGAATAPVGAWYTQGDFAPGERIEVTVSNPLAFDRPNCPVVIRRGEFPVADIAEMLVTVVDPALPPAAEPTPEERIKGGPHQLQAETHGHALFRQLDDLDKDGIWDELYFTTDLPAGGSKTLYIYLGFNQRGWNPHGSHAGIGSYCRHLVPFWESAHIGWKLWFPGSVDVYAKRKGQLMSQHLYMENLDGYAVPYNMGSDVQSVDTTFGGGGICVFEQPDDPTRLSRPRFTPVALAQATATKFNAGQLSDTRYAYDVVVNGPLRSAVRVKTMNWRTGHGIYVAEQLYFAYAGENYSTCRVTFPEFHPAIAGTLPGCGFRQKPKETGFFQEGGIAISAGPEEVRNPDETLTAVRALVVDFVGGALVVPDRYAPEYVFNELRQGGEVAGNHVFRVRPDANGSFEYMIAGAWSEGEVLKDFASFKEYVRKVAAGMNAPAQVSFSKLQQKSGGNP
jgi:hypothetical protein